MTIYLDLCDIYNLIQRGEVGARMISNGSYSLVSKGGVFTPEGYFL